MEKQNTPRDRNALQRLIDSKIEESGSLEYKAAGALDRSNPRLRDELTKDVSAFANAAGGILIYGIKEFDGDRKHLPELITPINSRAYSREWLDQIIGQIQPRIEGLEIIPIHVGPDVTDFCYVVVIPQSNTAHQATDKRYHRRRNFEVTAMDDYEVRDVMNRRKTPMLSVLVKIVAHPLIRTQQQPHPKRPDQSIIFNIKNESNVMAQHYGLSVSFPYIVNAQNIGFMGDHAYFSSEDGKGCWRFFMASTPGSPLFPKAVDSLEKIIKGDVECAAGDIPSLSEILITAYADSMEPIYLRKNLEKALIDWV